MNQKIKFLVGGVLLSCATAVTFQNCSNPKIITLSSTNKVMNGLLGSVDDSIQTSASYGPDGSLKDLNIRSSVYPPISSGSQSRLCSSQKKLATCQLEGRPVVAFGELIHFKVRMLDESGNSCSLGPKETQYTYKLDQNKHLLTVDQSGPGIGFFNLPAGGKAQIVFKGMQPDGSLLTGQKAPLATQVNGHWVIKYDSTSIPAGSYTRAADIYDVDGTLICSTNTVKTYLVEKNPAVPGRSLNTNKECLESDFAVNSFTPIVPSKKICGGYKTSTCTKDQTNTNCGSIPGSYSDLDNPMYDSASREETINNRFGSAISIVAGSFNMLVSDTGVQSCFSGRGLISRLIKIDQSSTNNPTSFHFETECQDNDISNAASANIKPSAGVQTSARSGNETTNPPTMAAVLPPVARELAYYERADYPFYECAVEVSIIGCDEFFSTNLATQDQLAVLNSRNPKNPANYCNAKSKSENGWRADYFSINASQFSGTGGIPNVELKGYGCATKITNYMCNKGTRSKVTEGEYAAYFDKLYASNPSWPKENGSWKTYISMRSHNPQVGYYTSRVDNEPASCQSEGKKSFEIQYDENRRILNPETIATTAASQQSASLSISRTGSGGRVGQMQTFSVSTSLMNAKSLSFTCTGGYQGSGAVPLKNGVIDNVEQKYAGPIEAGWVGKSSCHYEVSDGVSSATFEDSFEYIP